MKIHPISLISFCLLVSFSSLAQDDVRYKLRLQNGEMIPSKNINVADIASFDKKLSKVKDRSFVIIQFETIPTATDRKLLQQSGIELLDYIPSNAYTATIRGTIDVSLLQKLKARAVIEPAAIQKMQSRLAKGNFPVHAITVPGSIDLWISFPKTFSFEDVRTELQLKNFDITSTLYKDYRIVALRISQQRLTELASLPIVEYVQAAPGEDQLLNNKSMGLSRASTIRSSLGRNLTGEGVVVGVGDDSNPNNHADFSGRMINRTATPGGNHGLHVMGTVGGAGIVTEKFAGYAPKATIIAQTVSGVLANIPAYVQDYGMVISNNSYGNVEDDCDMAGAYDLYSRILDQQAADFPHLQNVFAAGNDGPNSCPNYPPGFKNVFGGYQSAKNVITVGATDELNGIASFSSEGPVRDGRIKPEIMAQGQGVISSWATNIYSGNNGTSMAAPAVSGGLALLYQHYKILNGGSNPKAGLMKAILCNGATDLGRPGPDYSYGFGQMNLLRSAIMIEKNNYHINSIATAAVDNYNLVVPANTAQLRVMLYWNDTAASVLASQTLVHDLDLEVIRHVPVDTTYLPFILDTIPGNVAANATTGIDRINNIEQVVIQNPAAGNYTLRVKGIAVNQKPTQEYFLVFDTIPVSTTLTYPTGGEKFSPGDSVYINWDSWGNPANTFSLEYSNNNGSSWSPVAGGANLPAATRLHKWFVPSGQATDTSNQYLIRITRDATAIVSTSQPFTVIGPTTVSLLPTTDQCEGYIAINWTPVIDATDYEVMWLRGDEMVSVATTTATTYTFAGLSRDSIYWVTVRPRLNGSPGLRANAISRQPNTGNCIGNISNNDLRIDTILSPVPAGRKFTSTEIPASSTVTIRIKNLDDVSSTGNFDVKYYINGVLKQTQTISPTITAGGIYDHSFSTTADFSAVGSDTLQVVVKKSGDNVIANDSTFRIVTQLDNQPLANPGDLPWIDDMETAPAQEIRGSKMGLTGRDRYDLITTTVYGRIRTFANSGMAYSGSKALTLDNYRYFVGGNVDSLIATFNLQNFNATADNLRFDFRYKNHGQENNAANRVWIRGSDTDSWIEVYNLFANQNAADGSYKLAAGIDISDSLDTHSQNFSSSFQVKWGQRGQYIAADDNGRDGYSFDDLRLYTVANDIQTISIDSPVEASCNLSNATQVLVSVYNSSNATVNNIPIVLKVNGSTVASETISFINAKDTIQHLFTTTANLSALGSYDIEVYTGLTSDTYKENDTVRTNITNSSVISSFPYLQDFETNNGSWYAGGDNSTWEYGTPNSIKINKAASGTKAWKTSGKGYYNDKEYSYLYSPCFDVSGMTNPTLSFNLALDIEDCGASALCDGAWVEYSTDGVNWAKLGAFGSGTNWYNRNYSGLHLWSQQNYTRWHVATAALPTSNNSRLRLRIVMYSDAGVTREGMGVDDIHIYDNLYGIYPTTGTSPVVNQPIVNGSSWINFTQGGQLIASINPNGQDLGSTNVQSFIHSGTVRNYSSQYYHNRNITIKPTTNNLGGPATVRFYFLDSETEALIAATGCGSCTKPSWFGELGVSKYSDPNDAVEDGDVTNSIGNYWSFITAANAKKVPFDKGYYAEFNVQDFSEFWLNDGWTNKTTALPAQLVSFAATKTANRKNVVAEWKTSSEINVNRFEIELAKGNDGLSQNQFTKIGEVASQGNSNTDKYYSFLDEEMNKTGVRYYRLKIIDNDGSFKYSPVRSVLFSDEVRWQVYPNPSASVFNLLYQLNTGERMEVKIHDASGRLVYQTVTTGNGLVQKLNIDMGGASFSSGLYLLEASSNGRKETFRLIKK